MTISRQDLHTYLTAFDRGVSVVQGARAFFADHATLPAFYAIRPTADEARTALHAVVAEWVIDTYRWGEPIPALFDADGTCLHPGFPGRPTPAT